MRVIVTGGAGYLGRATARKLITKEIEPVVLDRIPTTKDFESHVIDLCDKAKLKALWKRLEPIDGVIHFAALALVGESFQKPETYFENNLLSTLHVAELAAQAKACLVHSSSCSVYGIPETVTPLTEENPICPISPYGESKYLSERILFQLSKTRSLRVLNLRYFNPAGALDDLSWGECHEPETHAVPLLVEALLQEKPFQIFGDDYPTPDGTCVRDYVHVEDLAEAHVLSLEALWQKKNLPFALNIGAGRGVSILELIRTAESVLKKRARIETVARRKGDPPSLVADISLSRKELGWVPKRDLRQILTSQHAWASQR